MQQKKQFKEQTFWASLSSELKGKMIPGMAVDAQDYGPGPSSISDPHDKIILTVRMLNGAMLPSASPHPVHLTHLFNFHAHQATFLIIS